MTPDWGAIMAAGRVGRDLASVPVVVAESAESQSDPDWTMEIA